MKLCIVTHRVVKGDGQGRVNYEIVWEAIRRQHHLTLVASEVDPQLQQSNLVNWIDISVKGVPTALLRNQVFAWQSGNWLRQHRRNLDAIAVNGAITYGASDINIVHFVHSSWLRSPVHTGRQHRDVYGLYQWMYTAGNSYWEKQAFRQSKVIVAISGTVQQQLLEIGISPERIQTITNGVDLQEFCPGSADRSKLGLPKDVTIALFVGDIRTNRKNLDTVLHALIQVPKLHLAVIGKIEDSPYPQLAAKLELSKRVHFLGYRLDVSEIMKAVDLFVFPTRYEPFGQVIVEAMATGLPVITTSSAGAAELVKPTCGIVLPDPEDIQTLVKAMIGLIRDRQLWQQMGQAARSIVEQHSWTQISQKYVNLFEDIQK